MNTQEKPRIVATTGTVAGLLFFVLFMACQQSEKPSTSSAEANNPSPSASSPSDGESGDTKDIAIKDEDGQTIIIKDDRKPPTGHPSDFFPSQPGTHWAYTIDIGTVDPLLYDEATWPLGAEGDRKSVKYVVRGLLEGALMKEKRPLRLEYSVGRPAPKQGPLEFPNGVELIVKKDEVGVFRNCKQAFWAITESGRFSANLVLTFDPDSPGAPGGGGLGWGGWGRGDGSSSRLLFFVDNPGISLRINDSAESLIFTGIERSLAGYEGTDCLHFIRKVRRSEEKPGEKRGHLDEAFMEEMWFARGKGLVRLVQRVGGQTSMTWNLKAFSPGKE